MFELMYLGYCFIVKFQSIEQLSDDEVKVWDDCQGIMDEVDVLKN